MTDSRKALNSWARWAGYADFDMYIRAGGSVLDARRDIQQRITRLQSALDALNSQIEAHERYPAQPQAKAPILEHDAEPDEPPDPHNAHIQGADE